MQRYRINVNDICIFVFLLFASILTCIAANITFGMIFSGILFVLIFKKARYSLFTEISFIIVFSFFQSWVEYKYQDAYGMINNAVNGVPLYEDIHMVCTISFLITILYFVIFTNLIKNEVRLYRKQIELSLFSCVLYIIVATILVVLVFPTAPNFIISERRTQGLSSTYGFALISLLLAAITFDMSYTYKLLRIFYIFIVFWFLGHAERVEVLGFISYLALKIFNREDFQMNLKNKKNEMAAKMKRFMLYLVAFVFLLFCIWIGVYRDGRGYEFSIFDLLKKLFVQATAGDVIYVFDCAVDMWKNGNLLHGITYLDYLYQLIPAAPVTYSVGSYIHNYYFTMGGALFFTEPMANFGIAGVIVTNITFCVWYYWVTKKSSTLRCMCWISIVIEVFRICWYGRDGWILAFFEEIPLLYMANRYILNRIKLRKSRIGE